MWRADRQVATPLLWLSVHCFMPPTVLMGVSMMMTCSTAMMPMTDRKMGEWVISRKKSYSRWMRRDTKALKTW